MMQWFAENGGPLLVSLLLLAAVAGILRYLIREKRRGRSACGNSCAACPMHGACHRG